MSEGFIISSSAEVVCFIMIFILLIGNTYETNTGSKRQKFFSICLCVCLVALFADFQTLTLNGNSKYTTILWPAYISTFVFGEIMITCFTYYIYEYLNQKSAKAVGIFTYANIVGIINSIGIAITLTLTAFGKIIYVEDGHFLPGSCNFMIGSSAMITIVASVIFTIRQRKKIGTHDAVAILIFFLMPFVARVIETLHPSISITISLTCFSMLVVYIMLQSKEYKEAQLREQLLNHYSLTDTLTNLKNRRAYNVALDSIDKDKFIGVIFSDINGLKNVNDTLGHQAGDEYINSYVNIMLKHFRRDEIYRISGDEFVILIPEIAESEFLKRAEYFKANIKQTDNIAALGYEYGPGSNILLMIEQAESLMYENKKEYHTIHGTIR